MNQRIVSRAEAVEEAISRRTGRKHCILVGRGTTAIHLALRAIEGSNGRGEVILPTIGCASIAQIVWYAGFRPVFADVELDTFTISVESIESKLTAETKAIMPVHIFGHAVPMAGISALAAERDLFVIEDAAQAAGGLCDGRPMGAHGDFSILSFSGDKIIRAGAGGAVLIDDDKLAATIAAEAHTLPPYARTHAYALKSLSHRNLYHSLIDLLRVDADLDLSDIFMSALPLYADLYVHRAPEEPETLDEIAHCFDTLDENNRLRVERGSQYEELLSGRDVTVPSGWASSGVLWRFSFLVNDPAKTTAVTQALRDEGIHASNHYWSLADLMYGAKDLPNTAHICPRIVNLWVDGTATPEYVARSCEIIERSLR